MTNNTPMDKWQKHQSNALAIAGLVVLIAMNVLAFILHIFPSWPWIVLAVVGTVFFAFVNFTNTVETNAPWKSYGAMIMLMVVAAIYALPIGANSVEQI